MKTQQLGAHPATASDLLPFATRDLTMTSQLINGVELSKTLRQTLQARIQSLTERGQTPGLAVILLGDHPASQVYVRNKVAACEQVGIHKALNEDPKSHGILVQLPLPAHIDAQRVIEAISPSKDVDGFHISSAGALMTGTKGFWPCTPYGCMKMLESIHYDLKGKHAVVIGRSNIVGKPMAMMLLQKNATVTICHSHTKNLADLTRQADLIVAAVGIRNVLTKDMVKPGAVVLDVGMNRDELGKLCGDVDFAGVSEVSSYITPVPGGVGPMTITMLLHNTVLAAEQLS